jgi:Nucleotidyl transferase AbiEii toxin, Type IV TA system
VTADVPGRGQQVDGGTSLTAFQVEVARLFFSLPASAGFLLAGGAALAAQHLTERPTQDLDFFTRRGGGDVFAARDSLEAAAIGHGWAVRRLRDTETFCRLVLSGPEDLLVDLAIDSPPLDPEATSSAGPTFSLEELAGRKLIALFGRAEARDFADVFALSARFPKAILLQRAAELDLGFDQGVLAEMFATLNRFADDELPVPYAQRKAMRDFFTDWGQQLLGD